MQAYKMAAVVSHDGSALGNRECQHRWIRNSLLSLASLLGRQHIMAEGPKFNYHRIIKILIGV